MVFNAPLSTLRLDRFVGLFAQGVVHAQTALDQNLIATSRVVSDPAHGMSVQKPDGKLRQYSMLELGFMPNAYHIQRADLDLKVGFSASVDMSTAKEKRKKKLGLRHILKGNLSVQSVDAAYATRYQFRMQGASRIQSSLACRPEPNAMITRLRQQISDRNQRDLGPPE